MEARHSRRRSAAGVPRMVRAWITATVVALLLSGCGLLEASPSPPSSADPRLATSLRDAIETSALLADLDRLAAITNEHGGTREAGSDGYAAAAEWVADQLRAAGYEVTLDPVSLPLFSQDDPGLLQILATNAPAFEGPRDFKAMLLSPSGDVTGRLYALGFDPAAAPGDRNGIGCDAGAWGDVPAGAIVLVQPGPCWVRTIAEHAQDAGATALISAYPSWGPGLVRRPTLIRPDGLRIPVVATTRDAGLVLAQAAAAGDSVHLRIPTTLVMRQGDNVIAETPGGDADHVVMLGGHLDSVIDGPGINDNGTGVAVILEIARELASLTDGRPGWKVRVAFWTGEEIGLWGSVSYANSLSSSDRSRIAAYLNFDMVGSPGGAHQVYDASVLQSPASAGLERLFTQAFDADGVAWELADFGGSSDYFQFDQLGVPVGGIGAEAPPGDACYHLACDTTDNIDAVLLRDMARAAAWATGLLASGGVRLTP
jgi:Zn-dependent M28 family amino/carboxypeptidase